MRKYLILAALLLLGSVITTVAQDVRYNFAQGEDFSKYKTYKWVDLKGADHVDDLTGKQIQGAIEANLTTKGLQKVDSDSADLYLDIQHCDRLTEKQFTSTPIPAGASNGPGMGRRCWYGITVAAWRQRYHHKVKTSSISLGSLRSTCMTAPRRNWCGEE